MANTWEVEVEVSTHDLLKQGVLAARRNVPFGTTFSVVYIAADEVSTDAEAMCLAAQMAACSSKGMPTSTTLISWPHNL